MDVRDLLERELAEQLAAREDLRGKSGEIVKLRITGLGGGTWVVDFSGPVPAVRASDEDAHCVISVSSDDLAEILGGKLEPDAAFLAGRIKVSGYLDLALKMAAALRSLGRSA